MVRVSNSRRSGAGFALKFSGQSVNGTTVSPWAITGKAHSGIPSKPMPATARLVFNMSRRVVSFAM